MALNPLILAETLRPWRGAGLLYILDDNQNSQLSPDEELDEELRYEEQAIEPVNLLLPEHAVEQSLHKTANLNLNQQVNHISPNMVEPAPSKANNKDGVWQKTSAKSVSVVKADPIKQDEPRVLAMAEWPEIWVSAYKNTLNKLPIPSVKPQVLWSYADLVYDLHKLGDPSRGELLRNLIKHLEMPRGSSVFWPTAVLDDKQAKCTNSQIFYSGLCALNPKAIFILGTSALQDISLPLHFKASYSQQIFQGRMYILLPEWQDLQQLSQFRTACAFLRTIIQQLTLTA